MPIPIAMRKVISIPRKLYHRFLAKSEKIFSLWIYRFSRHQLKVHDHVVLLDNMLAIVCLRQSISFFPPYKEKKNFDQLIFLYTMHYI